MVKPLVEGTQCIKHYKMPKTKKELQRFLGLINYDRMPIKNSTEILKSLYGLLKTGEKYNWNEIHNNAFEDIKKVMCHNLELYIPDMDGEFVFEADASQVGIGGILSQNGKIVYCLSKSLSSTERNYSITERELLAALWCMEKLEYFLLGRKFKLVTDHKAIEEAKRKGEFESYRLKRWFKRLERFDFDVEYRKGENMQAVDALSRSTHIENSSQKSIEEKVYEMHMKMNHRKDIHKLLEEYNLRLSEERINKILWNCEICAKMNPKTRSPRAIWDQKAPDKG